MIRYQIGSRLPASHYFDVCIHVETPDPDGQCLRLPNWIPGSYMIRDFARNLLDLCAEGADGELAIEQIDKSNWRVAACEGAVTINYKVYARDLSVRAAHLDHSHGYYNGSSVFLEVMGQADQPCEVLIERPRADHCAQWRVATSLQREQAEPFGFGLYRALDYDDLIDHPVEMGTFGCVSFEACGVPHDIILSGRFECDEARLAADLRAICEHHIRFFGEPAPMDYYQFQVMVIGSGYGGLEHRASTSLVTKRDSLPKPGQVGVDDDYRDFLGLCSHEYFHTWNVKRIRPEAYRPYQLQQEVYTDLLWAFEGITSYYDDLGLLRSGLIDTQSYLELFAQVMTRVQRGRGRLRQSVAESSFNAWTKFYKQDENAANAIVSYYARGCLVAACIDLKLRALSDGARGLDDVMRRLWQDYLEDGEGVEPEGIQRLVSEIAGADLGSFLRQLIYSTDELPLVELLEGAGIEVIRRVAKNGQDRGGKDASGELPAVDPGAALKEDDGGLVVLRVSEQGALQLAGLSADDVIVAIDGLKLSLAQLENRLLRAQAGDVWRVHAFRRDELNEFDVTLQAAAATTFVLKVADPERAEQAWLDA
ncbi:MAG: M61 family metallopeptidase [Gammaproteobacteria bacterium]|nr:M61 family metallopeptidase [Gammaproteobacteria bacterium]